MFYCFYAAVHFSFQYCTQHQRAERSHSLYVQGSHASLKVLEFFSPKFKALKVLENRTGACKSLNFILQVLESP